MPTDVRLRAASQWIGYGRWSAPYWFIGVEQGGSEDGPEAGSYDAWARLGGGELLDCRAHHREFNCTRWHGGPRPATQPTWRGLIQMLLGYMGEPAGLEDIRAYQCSTWGSADGDAALLELSGLRAPNSTVTNVGRTYRDARIRLLRARLDTYQPKFVVCYGVGARPSFAALFGQDFDAAGYVIYNGTVGVLVPHPAARGPRERNWVVRGQMLRRRVVATTQIKERSEESLLF